MKSKLFSAAVMLLCAGIPGLGAGPEQNDPGLKKLSPFSLEIYGGFRVMQPDDLNLLADYYNAYPLFFLNGQYDYLHSQYGDAFTYSVSRSGDDRLQSVSSGLPGGIRLRYAMSRHFSLAVSLEYFKENRLSSTQLDYRIVDLSQGLVQATPLEVEAGYPDFFLGVSAWVPQVGIHWAVPLGSRWRVGASFSAGPLLARCRSVVETRSKYRYSDGYWSEAFYLLEMKGASTGLALDLNAELRRRLTRRLSFFMATGYAWRRAANITGAGRSQSLARDSNATQDLVENSWQGRWRKKDAYSARNWGEFTRTYSGNYFSDNDDTDEFVLDLSGFQVKAGFSWNF